MQSFSENANRTFICRGLNDAKIPMMLPIFLCCTFFISSLFIVSFFPQKNAHKDLMLLVIKPFRTLFFVCFIAHDYYEITSLYAVLISQLAKKKVWCSAKRLLLFFVCLCVCCVRCPPNSVRPGSKKVFMSLSLLLLWCFELMKMFPTTRRGRRFRRMQVGFTWHFAI